MLINLMKCDTTKFENYSLVYSKYLFMLLCTNYVKKYDHVGFLNDVIKHIETV
jgi:hypothetical protein